MQKNNNSILEGLLGKSQQEAISTPLDPASHHWNNRLEEWPSVWRQMCWQIRLLNRTHQQCTSQSNGPGQVGYHVSPKKIRTSFETILFRYCWMCCFRTSRLTSILDLHITSLLPISSTEQKSLEICKEIPLFFWSCLVWMEAINIQPLVHMSR